MYTGFLHTHALVTALFMLMMLIFAFLMFAGRNETLDKLDKKTKILRIVLGVLILVTGVFLLTQSSQKTEIWFLVKLGIVVAAIPVGIIGLKKRKGVLALLSAIMFIYVYGVSEAKSLTFSKEAKAASGASADDMKSYYSTTCTTCHGEDGKATLSGAKDLSVSTMSDNEIKTIISEGKAGTSMEAYVLKDEELDELVKYVKSLRKE